MSVQGWRWWQWFLVSLVVGGLVGWSMTNRELDDPSVPSTSLGAFIRKLDLRTDNGEPVVAKIRVSPVVLDDAGKKVQVVTFWEKQKNKETGKWDPTHQYRMYTSLPVFPRAPRADYGILDYLADRKKDMPLLETGYSWWQVPRNAWLVSMGGSILLIGVAWPMVIRAMVKLGLGNPDIPQEAGYDMSSVRTRSSKPVAAAVKTDAAAELEAINARLETSVADMLLEDDRRDEEAERKHEEAVIRQLSNTPLESQESAGRSQDDKSFDGEFYPVARPITKSE